MFKAIGINTNFFLTRKDVMSCIKDGSYCSMWQLHGLASIVGAPINSVYPKFAGGPIRSIVNRTASISTHTDNGYVFYTTLPME